MLLFCLLVSKLLAQKSRFYAKTTPFVPSPLFFVLCSLSFVLVFVLCPLFFVLVFVLCDKYQRPFPCLSQIKVVATTKREEK